MRKSLCSLQARPAKVMPSGWSGVSLSPAPETKPAAKRVEQPPPSTPVKSETGLGKITVSGLQYHINIVLPDTRDQAVYDAIFKSLREHLG